MSIEFSHYEVQQTSDPKQLMRLVFKTQKQADIATQIIETIKEKREIYDHDMKELAKSANCSEKWFYSRVLRTLQRIGMIRKDLNRYFLSTDFANSLRRLERGWRDFV
jgi:DNA-binding IclR family transcriptional regulator